MDPWFGDIIAPFTARWLLQLYSESYRFLERLKRIEDLIDRIEGATTASNTAPTASTIEAIVVTHVLHDNTNKPSLERCRLGVPIFAVQDALEIVNSLNHFETIVPLTDYDTSAFSAWQSEPQDYPPEWLTIQRLSTPNPDSPLGH
jgi:hypothetical protein